MPPADKFAMRASKYYETPNKGFVIPGSLAEANAYAKKMSELCCPVHDHMVG